MMNNTLNNYTVHQRADTMDQNNISRKIETLLTCALCRLPYKEPKTLPCAHSFCKRCLGDYILQQRIKQNDAATTATFPCPTCSASCPMPQKLASLPGQEVLKNLVDTMNTSTSNQQCTMCSMDGKRQGAAYYCTKCEDFLCDDCSRIHKKTRMTVDHLLVRLTSMAYAHKAQSGPTKVVAKFGRHGEDLNTPCSLCTNKADDVIVSNTNNDIAVFSATGSCKKHLNQQPFYGDTTRFPHHPNRCVAFTQEGYLAVAIRKKSSAESSATCVAVIQSLAGREIGTCVTKVSEYQHCTPSGIAVMLNGNIVVSDVGLHCVYVFDNRYQFIRKFGKRGSGSSKFTSPYYVSVNILDEILVSDYGNHCIKIFDDRGKFRRRIGSMGAGDGQLLHPMGLCCDQDMNILVADRDNHRIQVFDAAGNFKTIIVKDTFEKGKDIRPTDVAFNNSGCLLVLMKGIEGEDFAEIRAFKYDLKSHSMHRRSKRGSSSRRYGSAPPGGRHREPSPSGRSANSEADSDFPSFDSRRSPKSQQDRSSLPPSGKTHKTYERPLNFEANIENRRPPTAPASRQYQDYDEENDYDSDGYDRHPRRQYPPSNSKPASKVCSIM